MVKNHFTIADKIQIYRVISRKFFYDNRCITTGNYCIRICILGIHDKHMAFKRYIVYSQNEKETKNIGFSRGVHTTSGQSRRDRHKALGAFGFPKKKIECVDLLKGVAEEAAKP